MAAFEVEVFEDLHRRVVAPLVSARPHHSDHASEQEIAAFEDLRKHRESLALPFHFRQRDDSVDLNALATRIQATRPWLYNQILIRQVDEVSRTLRLHQDDSAALVDRAFNLGGELKELPRTCASMYYRECHFQALCLHDMAQSLTRGDRFSVVFFAMLGGPKFVVSGLLEALGRIHRDLTGARAGDQLFLAHADAMFQLVVETMLSYFYKFVATPDETEQIIALLPHVITQQHAPIQKLEHGWNLSDMDMILREAHADLSTKLCLTLVCMFHPRDESDAKLDIVRLNADLSQKGIDTVGLHAIFANFENFVAQADDLYNSNLGQKMKQATAQHPFWDEESQLGQFLCFAISGAMGGEHANRAQSHGYVHWHVLHFLLEEVLLSHKIIGDSCSSQVILKIILELLAKVFLADSWWVHLKRLEADAVSRRLVAVDHLQIEVLRTLNRLCRLYPPACEKFRDMALHVAETFYLTIGQSGGILSDGLAGATGVDAFGNPQMFGQAGLYGQSGLMPMQTPMGFSHGVGPWYGAPLEYSNRAQTSTFVPRHDNSRLYAEILDLIATVCGRGSLKCAKHVATKLTSHSNQWFNWGFILDNLLQHVRLPTQVLAFEGQANQGSDRSFPPEVIRSICHLVSAMCSSHLWLCQPPPQLTGNALQTSFYAESPNIENYGGLLVELLRVHPSVSVKAACLGALAHLDFSCMGARSTFMSITAILPTLLSAICDFRGRYDGLLAIELLACALRLAQAVPLNKGRYSLDLQPLTHIVIHHILLKVLADSGEFSKSPRYWRLANLALRWLRMTLHGPLPFGSSPAGNMALIEPYAGGDAAVVSQVAALNSAGNATSYVFRCLLALDSPVLTHVLYLATLRGRGVDGLAEGRRNGCLRPFMEQTARVGLDVIRLLLQRDVLFCRLFSQRTKAHLEGTAEMDASSLLLTHKLLFSEFAFAYPPEENDEWSRMNSNVNAFAGRRLWQGQVVVPSAIGPSGRRGNPSNFALLLEFVGAQQSPEISKLALFVFAQCSLREPSTSLKMLQLEPWRLQRFCVDLHDMILMPEGEGVMASMSEVGRDWDKQKLGPRFTFEVAEMDTPADVSAHLDMSSFLTGMSLCHAVDSIYQLADDSMVQTADIVAFAAWSGLTNNMRGLGLPATSGDEAMFKAGYLRGLDIPSDWIGAEATSIAYGRGGCPPPATLSITSCRLLALRMLVMLQGEIMSQSSPTSTSPKLAQVILGLDPDSSKVDGCVVIDSERRGQPSPLDAVMILLENLPRIPSFSTRGDLGKDVAPRASMSSEISQAVDQHTSYEAALGILLGLLSTPSLCDVGFRYMVHSWTARYNILRTLLQLPWPRMPSAIRRVMLAEVTMTMEAVSWEMRLVPPFGSKPPPLPRPLTTAARQRLDIKHKVAEDLQVVVRSFLTTAEVECQAHGETPLLIAIAQQLAEACGSSRKIAAQPIDAVIPRDATYESLQASGCTVLVPSLEGPLKLGIELRDPHIFLCLAGQGYRVLTQDPVGAQFTDALCDVGIFNEAACMEFFSHTVFRSLSLFVRAMLYHLAGGVRPSTIARDPRAQDLRAHVEALLPELAPQMLNTQPACRIEIFARYAVDMIQAMQRVESPPPLSLAHDLFRVLRSVAVHEDVTPDARGRATQALLFLLQRNVPDSQGAASAELELAELTDDDLKESQKLVRRLLTRASSPDTDFLHTFAEAPAAAPAPDIALPLLAALLARIPVSQLDAIFPTPDLWQQLAAILRTVPVGNPRGYKLRCAAMSVAVALCRKPAFASALFENHALEAALDLDLMQSSKVQISPPGLPLLEIPHPVIVLSILEVLAAIVGVLQTHRMVLSLALNWMEQHHRSLLELLQWVSRLPVSTSAEPRPFDPGSLGGRFGSDGFTEALQEAVQVSNIVEHSAGMIQSHVLMVYCESASTVAEAASDSTLELVSLALSGRCWLADLNANSSLEDRDRVVALCHRCTSLFCNLYASVGVAVQKIRCPHSQVQQQQLLAQMARLASIFEPTLSLLLSQMAATDLPKSRDTIMKDAFESDKVEEIARWNKEFSYRAPIADQSGQNEAGLYASEATRLSICIHLLHAWRHDESTTHIRTLVEQSSSSIAHSMSPGSMGGAMFSQISQSGALVTSSDSSMVSQLITLARSRVNVLCTVFVHTCHELLSMHPASNQFRGRLAGAELASFDQRSLHLHFDASRERFMRLLFVVEVSLHLLQTHLSALILGGQGAAPTPGAPRMPLVLQYLRALQHFMTTVDMKLALAEQSIPGREKSIAAGGMDTVVRLVDLGFAVRAAGRVEQSLRELQSL